MTSQPASTCHSPSMRRTANDGRTAGTKKPAPRSRLGVKPHSGRALSAPTRQLTSQAWKGPHMPVLDAALTRALARLTVLLVGPLTVLTIVTLLLKCGKPALLTCCMFRWES